MCDMETDSKDHKLCRGCLSSDRRLTFVTTDHIYYSLLTEEQKQDVQTIPCICLCWECAAMLRRMKKFQAQVQKTHMTLQNCLGLYLAKPLSTLGTHHKLDYDAIFEERNPNEQVDTIITPTKYKTLDIEMKAENVEDVKSEEISTELQIEYSSDDYDDHDAIDDTLDTNLNLNLPEITIKTIQKSDKNIAPPPIKRIPIVKTPALLKLEQEIQDYINSRHYKFRKTTPKKKCDKSKDDESNDLNGVSKNEDNEPKRKLKREKRESDPDFSGDSDSNSGGNSKKRTRLNKNNRFHKVFTKYRDIGEVLSYFTKVRLSLTDFKSVLEKEDAVVDSQKPYKCNVCGKIFEFHRIMRSHAACHKRSHPEYFKKGNFSNDLLPIPEDLCLWRCSICSRMLRREHVVTHVNRNHSARYFCTEQGCEWLQRFYWTREDHKEHFKAFHTQYLCDICGKTRTRRKAIEAHMRDQHLKVLSHPCSQCELKFTSTSSLRQHVLYKHSDDPPELCYCVECDVTFPSVIQLNCHFNNKHKHAGVRFPCGECGREFPRKFALKTHYNLIHLGKTKFQCNICGKYLSKKKALDRHLDAHKNIKLPYTKPCTVCGRMFQTNKTLQNHMYTHTGERPHRCTYCDAAYTQLYCLKVHLKKQHGVDTILRDKRVPKPVASLDSV